MKKKRKDEHEQQQALAARANGRSDGEGSPNKKKNKTQRQEDGNGLVENGNGVTSTPTASPLPAPSPSRLARFQSERASLPIWLARKQLLEEVIRRAMKETFQIRLSVFFTRNKLTLLYLPLTKPKTPAARPRHRHPRRGDGLRQIHAAPAADARRRARRDQRKRREQQQ